MISYQIDLPSEPVHPRHLLLPAWSVAGCCIAGLFPSKDTLVIADLDAARSVMASEMQLGIGSDWPKTFSEWTPLQQPILTWHVFKCSGLYQVWTPGCGCPPPPPHFAPAPVLPSHHTHTHTQPACMPPSAYHSSLPAVCAWCITVDCSLSTALRTVVCFVRHRHCSLSPPHTLCFYVQGICWVSLLFP